MHILFIVALIMFGAQAIGGVVGTLIESDNFKRARLDRDKQRGYKELKKQDSYGYSSYNLYEETQALNKMNKSALFAKRWAVVACASPVSILALPLAAVAFIVYGIAKGVKSTVPALTHTGE